MEINQELVDEILNALIHSAGDHRKCVKCCHNFIPKDITQASAWKAFQKLDALNKLSNKTMDYSELAFKLSGRQVSSEDVVSGGKYNEL